MQRAVHDVNKDAVDSETKRIIFSQDVKALYPSLSIEDIKELVKEVMMETEVEYKNLDIKMVAKYLAVNMTKEEQRKENIISCIPDRLTELEGTGRKKVGMAYLDSDFINKKDKYGKIVKVEKWSWKSKREPSHLQRRKMLAEMMRL